MNIELSQRLGALRFPLIVGIVFIHNYGTSVGFAGEEVRLSQHSFLTYFLENLISMGIARSAVPLFFLMSGYLFFFGWDGSAATYAKKLRSRAGSLLIPFLFWNLATLLLMALAQSLPACRSYFSGRVPMIAGYSGQEYLAALLGVGRAPIAYQFWFIRDLMILVLATPLIRLLNERLAPLFLPAVFALWFLGVGFGASFVPSMEALLFFSAGAYLGANGKDLMALDPYGKPITATYVVLLLLSTIFFNASIHFYLYQLTLLLGVLTALYASKLLLSRPALLQLLLSLGVASFFVYAAHEPLLTLLRKLAYKCLRPESAGMVLLLYFTIPVLVVLLLLAAYRLLLRVLPRFTSVITGGR